MEEEIKFKHRKAIFPGCNRIRGFLYYAKLLFKMQCLTNSTNSAIMRVGKYASSLKEMGFFKKKGWVDMLIRLRRFVGILLVLALLVNMLPAVIAVDAGASEASALPDAAEPLQETAAVTEAEQDIVILDEITENRTANTEKTETTN